MAFQFAYIIMMVVISSPGVTAAVQSDAYASIFSAQSDEEFVNALNTYLGQYLSNTDIQTNNLIRENGTQIQNRTLETNFSIEQEYTALAGANETTKIEFLVLLGTNESSEFQVQIKQGVYVQTNIVNVTTSTKWNEIVLNQSLTGTFSVNITGLATHTGDSIPSFSNSQMLTQTNWTLTANSQYYHTYQYVIYVEGQIRVYDPVTHQYYWVTTQVPQTVTGWKTDTLAENPAIRIQNNQNITWDYSVGSMFHGHHSIYDNSYVNGVKSSQLKGYADYPELVGYAMEVEQIDPDPATAMPLDQLLELFMQDQGLEAPAFDVNAFLAELVEFLQNIPLETDPRWQQLENNFSTFFYPINGPYDTSHPTKYTLKEYTPLLTPSEHYLGLYEETWQQVNQCLSWINLPDGNGGSVRTCIEYSSETYMDMQTQQLVGKVSLATSIGFPSSFEDILLLKTWEMVTYPSQPYFFNWLVDITQTKQGIQYDSSLLADIQASMSVSPTITASARLIYPYLAQVNVTDSTGSPAFGTVNITVKDTQGSIVGTGTIVNGTGYISATSGSFEPNDVVLAENPFYITSQTIGTIIPLQTTINVSLVLDPNATTGQNPYVADVTIKDSRGNMILGEDQVSVFSSGTQITSGTAYNGSGRIPLPGYYESLTAVIGGSTFYEGSAGSGTVQYDLAGMIQTQGPAGTDPILNAKWAIITDYVEHSGAFDHDSATGMYTMNNNDAADLWTDTVGNIMRGYALVTTPVITQGELDNKQFNSNTIKVMLYYGEDIIVQQKSSVKTLPKMDFFDVWLGQKLIPCSYGANPPDPSGFTGLDSLASDFATILSKDQSYFQTDSGAQDFSAKVQGLLTTATNIGFPEPQGLVQELAAFINGIIDAFLNAIATIWNAIVSFVGIVANFVMSLWDNVIGPVLGPAIELVKNIVSLLFNQIVNVAIQPMLDGQRTSLSDIYGGESINSTIDNVSPILNEIGSHLSQSVSKIEGVTPMMETMFIAGSLFDGTGTILEPLIIIAGPGIIITLFDVIATKALDFLITPFLNQISSSYLEYFVNNITNCFGGMKEISNKTAQVDYDSTDIIIKGKIDTQQFDPQQNGNIQQSSEQSNPSCNPNDLSCRLTTLFLNIISFSNLIEYASSSGVFNIFDPIIETFLSCILKLFEGFTNPDNIIIVTMGILAMLNDLLGGLRSKSPNGLKPLIQWIRVNILLQETRVSFIKLANSWNSHLVYNGLISLFWVIKSCNSLISETLGGIADSASVIFDLKVSLEYYFSEFLNGKSISDYINIIRSKMVVIGIVINTLIFLGKDFIFPLEQWINPLTTTQLGFSFSFLVGFLGESIAKRNIYINNAYSPHMNGNNEELYTFLGSSMLDGFQMIVSILGF